MSNVKTEGISTLGLLGVVFVVLKLTGTINWSWVLVLLPFYVAVPVMIVIFAVVGFVALIKALLS